MSNKVLSVGDLVEFTPPKTWKYAKFDTKGHGVLVSVHPFEEAGTIYWSDRSVTTEWFAYLEVVEDNKRDTK